MKKQLLLQSLAVMSIFTLTQARDAQGQTGSSQNKPAHHKSAAKHEMSGKEQMHSIEKEINQVRQEYQKAVTAFHKDKNAKKLRAARSKAMRRLKTMPAKIDKAVARMKADENAGRMWETHQHTLNRKLREAREFVKKQVRGENDKAQA